MLLQLHTSRAKSQAHIWSACHVADHSLTIADRRHLALYRLTTVYYQPPQPASWCFKSAFYTYSRQTKHEIGFVVFFRPVSSLARLRYSANPTGNSVNWRIYKCVN